MKLVNTEKAGETIIFKKYDKLSKLACRIFANSLLRFIGEKDGIKNIYTYEIYTPPEKLKILDMVIETTNGYCIDFEFHKSRTTEDIILRNIQYVVSFRLESKKLIKPYVISMAEAEKSIKKARIWPELEIEIPFIFFKNYNGDERLRQIKEKMENDISIEEFDLFNLIFIPFMEHEKSDYEITKEIIHLANEIKLTEEQQYQIKACQIILVDIFMPEDEKEKMLKVVNMGSQFLEEYERKLVEDAEKNGKEKGIKEGYEKGEKKGKEKGIKEGYEKGEKKGKEKERLKLAKKLKKDNVPMQKIIKYTGLSLSVIQKL